MAASAIAVGPAADGFDLVLNHWRPYDERVELVGGAGDTGEVAAECRDLGVRVDVVAADLADSDAPARLVDAAPGRLRGLVLSHCESVDTGSIVALTSDHTAHNLPYGASKGALDRLVIAAAVELGGRGLRANVVNPGPIDTGWMTDEIRAAALERTPTGRLGTPSDIADLVRFLLSDAGGWITGRLLHADGGFAAGRESI